MYTFDRKKFFDAYRTRFGALTQDLVNALESLLSQIEADTQLANTETGLQQLAYCLATFKWETAHTMRPIDEYGSTNYFNSRYGPQTKVGKELGNTKSGDGALFHGRGYVQLTGRTNYTKAKAYTGADLLTNPAQAKDEKLAYQIALQGMTAGWFTGRKLSQFFKAGSPPDYENARTIINGHNKAQTIADIARRFYEILRVSQK